MSCFYQALQHIIYTFLFISNTDSKKRKKTITIRTRKTSNHLQAIREVKP